MTGCILIADAVAGERIVLRARLAAQAYTVLCASDAAELKEALGRAPDVIVLPRWLGQDDGLALCRQLRDRADTRAIPVIVRLERPDFLTRIRALEAGADAVIESQAAPALMNARIRNLLRRHVADREILMAAEAAAGAGFSDPAIGFAHAARVVVIAPSLREGLRWRGELTKKMRASIRVIPEHTALSGIAREAAPDAILLAENSIDPARTQLLISALMCRSHTMRAAVLLLQRAPAPDRMATALDMGVADVVDTGFDARDLALRLGREVARKRAADAARTAMTQGLRMAVTDPLTGLYNRRYAIDRLNKIALTGKKGGPSYAVLALDLDRFKTINDRFGHAAGDRVLSVIATRMHAALRQGDFLARMGGEEFLAVIRAGGVEAATAAANRLRQEVAATPVVLPNGSQVNVTVSIGLAMSDGSLGDIAVLLDRADRALYDAKSEGRNQVTVSSAAA